MVMLNYQRITGWWRYYHTYWIYWMFRLEWPLSRSWNGIGSPVGVFFFIFLSSWVFHSPNWIISFRGVGISTAMMRYDNIPQFSHGRYDGMNIVGFQQQWWYFHGDHEDILRVKWLCFLPSHLPSKHIWRLKIPLEMEVVSAGRIRGNQLEEIPNRMIPICWCAFWTVVLRSFFLRIGPERCLPGLIFLNTYGWITNQADFWFLWWTISSTPSPFFFWDQTRESPIFVDEIDVMMPSFFPAKWVVPVRSAGCRWLPPLISQDGNLLSPEAPLRISEGLQMSHVAGKWGKDMKLQASLKLLFSMNY